MAYSLAFSKLSNFLKKVEKMPKMGVSDFAPKLAILVHDRFLPKSRKKTLQIAPLGPHFSNKWSIPHFDFSAVLSLGVGGVQSGGHFFVLKFVDFWRGQKKCAAILGVDIIHFGGGGGVKHLNFYLFF